MQLFAIIYYRRPENLALYRQPEEMIEKNCTPFSRKEARTSRNISPRERGPNKILESSRAVDTIGETAFFNTTACVSETTGSPPSSYVYNARDLFVCRFEKIMADKETNFEFHRTGAL